MFFVGNVYKQFVNSLKLVGFRGTLSVIVSRLADFSFDNKYGTDTIAWIELDDCDVNGELKNRGQRYQPSGTLSFRKLMRHLKLPPGEVLIDFGSGKGRVLLMAIEYGFSKAVGVEFSPEMCKVTRENVVKFTKKFGRAVDITIAEGDAAEYHFKDEETVFYFYHPFDETILKKVLDNISASLKRKPRQAWLIYYYPIHRDLIEQPGSGFRKETELVLFGYKCVIYHT